MNNDLENRLARCVSDLRREKENWILLANRIADGLVVVDEGGMIRFLNRAAAAMLQRESEALTGKPFGFPLMNGEVSELNLLARDGSILVVEMRCTPTRWDEAPAWAILMHDITEMTRIRREIEQLNTRLTMQVKDLEQFSYSLAHDLRSPLRAINGFAELIEEDLDINDTLAARTHLERICQRTRFMETLMEGMLRFARSTLHPLELQKVDLNQLVRTVVITLAETIPNVADTVKVDPLPVVHGDSLLLQQVFTNVISNAVKYSAQARRPEVRVSASHLQDTARVSVSDNGVGFESDSARRIFDVFTRLEPKKTDGVGVGLSIVKNIVVRHGGHVWAEGEPGKGATIHLEFPIHPPRALPGNENGSCE
jgi:signal transduction histidine kinase